MPDFDKLHDLSKKLASLTAPGQREEGLGTWAMIVGEIWGEIAGMWDDRDGLKAKIVRITELFENLTKPLPGGPQHTRSVSVEAFNQLEDFIVNHCGEDEL